MEKRQIVWLFILLTFCSGYIFSFSLLGEQAFERVFAQNNGFTEGTTIGAVDVSHLSEQEALDKLQTETKKWADETILNLQYKEKSIGFSNDNLVFLLEKSINLVKNGGQTPFVVELQEGTLNSILTEFGIAEDHFNKEAFIQAVLSYPSMLTAGTHMIKLDDYMLEGPENQLISEAAVTHKDIGEQLDLWVSHFPTVTIAPHSQYSVLAGVEESGVRTFTSEGLSVVATAIYQAVLPTNFQITERSTSRELPSYVKAGYEAKVDVEQDMDLVISNVTDYEYILEFNHLGDQLTVSFTGPAYLYQYKIIEKNHETFKPKNILQYDAKLEPDQQVVRKKGQEGLLINIIREILDQNGALLNREFISEDFYPPVHAVVATGLKAPKAQIESEEEGTLGEEQNTNQTGGTGSENPKTPPVPQNVAPGIAPDPTQVIPPAGEEPPPTK